MKFGLDNALIERVQNTLSHFPDITEVVIYGSRAKGNFRPGSDIDLTLKGKNLHLETLNRIRCAIDDLSTPYTFDLSLFDHIDNRDLLEHIERVGQTFYAKSL